MRNAAKVDPQALQQIFLNELNRGDAEAYILVRREFWKQCKEWDGHSLRRTQILFNNDKWIQIIMQQSEDGLYDLFSFVELTDVYNKLKTQENRLLQAEEESKSKTSFLYRMSHEIRTPMNGIMGMLTLAKEVSDTVCGRLLCFRI